MSARVEIYREREQVGPFAHDGSDWDNPTRPGKWRWRFIKNGNIMADSGQVYSRRIDAFNGCAKVLGGEPAGDHITRHAWRGGFQRIPVVDLTREEEGR